MRPCRRHMLQHDASGAPTIGAIRFLRVTKCQRKAGRYLFGLRKIGLRTGRKRSTRNRGDPLIGLHILTLIDQYSKIPIANLIKARCCCIQRLCIIACIGPNTRRRAIFCRAIVVRCNQTHRTAATHLQREFPAQLNAFTNQCREQSHLCHQCLNHRWVIMLRKHLIQYTIKPRDAATNVGCVQLKR